MQKKKKMKVKKYFINKDFSQEIMKLSKQL